MSGKILYEPPPVHVCQKPPTNWYDYSTVWQCDKCQQLWELGKISWYRMSRRASRKFLKKLDKLNVD